MHAEEGPVAGVVGGWGRDVKRAEVFLAFKGLEFLLLGVWFLLWFLRFRILRLGLGLVFGPALTLVASCEKISIAKLALEEMESETEEAATHTRGCL